jgi:hypothetical protein
MASGIDYGQKIQDHHVRNALQKASEEISALSGHVAAAVGTLAVGTDGITATINNLRDLKASMIAAGLLSA